MDTVRDFLFVWLFIMVVFFPEAVGSHLYKVHQGYIAAASSVHEQVKK